MLSIINVQCILDFINGHYFLNNLKKYSTVHEHSLIHNVLHCTCILYVVFIKGR